MGAGYRATGRPADNAMPHLLTEAGILTAFRQFYHYIRPGGGCLITVRDYYLANDGTACTTHVMRTKYYEVSTDRLIVLMRQAGFVEVERLDNRFYQPVIVGSVL